MLKQADYQIHGIFVVYFLAKAAYECCMFVCVLLLCNDSINFLECKIFFFFNRFVSANM